MPRLEAKTRKPPAAVRKLERQDECVRLRRSGLSYRVIGAQVGISHERVRELCEEAYKEVADSVIEASGATLGEELERIDGVIRVCSGMMLSSGSSEAARLRAAEIVRRCSDTKVRWLGLAAPERISIEGQRTWADMVSEEVAAMSSDELDRELSALGYGPLPDDRLLTKQADAA